MALGASLLTYLGTTTVLLAVTIYLLFKYWYSYWDRLGVVHPKTEFIYGNVKGTVTLEYTLGEQLQKFYNEYKAKGHKYIGFYFFHQPFLMPIDTELVKNIMSKDFDHFVDRGAYCNEEGDPLSAHLFSLEGTRWKHLRQKLTPTFTSGKLKKMFQTLVDCTEELKDCLDESVTKEEPIDIKKYLVQYTTDVIGSCAFGLECNSFKNPDSEFIRYGAKIFNPELFDRFKFFFSFLFPNVASFFKLRATNIGVDKFFRNLVKDTIDYREKNNVSRNDFMQLLIQLKNNGVLDEDEDGNSVKNPAGTSLTLMEATAQAFLFFIAGFETSSTTMTFCLLELAKNPEVQEKARKEILNVLKKYNGKICYDSVMDMPYMEKVIQETLRKHPPVMILQRKVTQSYQIPDSDLVLEKGVKIFIPALALQHDPEYYPEPQKFDPERFSEENKSTRPDFTWLPFGDGPRNCIGLRFGMMQTKVGLCRLLINYRFTLNSKTPNPLKFDANSFIRSVEGGVWLNAEKVT